MKIKKDIEYVDQEIEKKKKKKNQKKLKQMNFKIYLTIFKTRLNQVLIFI